MKKLLAILIGLWPSFAYAVTALDGSAQGTWSAGTTFTVTLTTTSTNDVIIVNVASNTNAPSSVTDAAGLTWNLRTSVTNTNFIHEYYATSSGTLTGDVITINYGAAPSYAAATAFGISGANTSSPFDANAALPGTSTSGNPTITTSNANDFLFCLYRGDNITLGPTTPFIGIIDNNYQMSEYEVVSATQAALSCAHTTGAINGAIGDAVVQASSGGGTIHMLPLLGVGK